MPLKDISVGVDRYPVNLCLSCEKNC